MKKLATAIAVTALIGTPAFAADMAVKAPPPAAPSVFSWTGCHLGGSFGLAFGRDGGYSTTSSSVFVFPPTHVPVLGGVPLANAFNMDSGIAGVDVGCDYQLGRWVFGAEGDWSSFITQDGSRQIVSAPAGLAVPTPGGGSVGFNGNDFWSAEARWLATARARFGYAIDTWLVYVTGGAAWMNIQSTESSNGFANSNVSQTDTRIGWTVGAGLDYALPAGWSLRAEYLYVKIPSYTTFSPGNGPGYATFGWITNLNNSLSENIVRFGVNYKFY